MIRVVLILMMTLTLPSRALAKCNADEILNDKPALDIMRNLEEQNLWNSKSYKDAEDELMNVYLDHSKETGTQLQLAIEIVRELRELAALKLQKEHVTALQRIEDQKEIEETAKRILKNNNEYLDSESESVIPKAIPIPANLYKEIYVKPEVIAYENLIRDQILRYPLQYFNPSFVNQVDLTHWNTHTLLVAAMPEGDGSFVLRFNFKGERQDFRVLKGQTNTGGNNYDLSLDRTESTRLEEPPFRGRGIQFFRVTIFKHNYNEWP